MNSKIVKLPANLVGTDFVVGDLHGCRHLLDAKLQEYGFNSAIDRVLSVGDLVDRGPDSWNTLRLIEESWFNFVLGNHEEMLLDLLADRTDRPLPVDQEAAWINEIDDEQFDYLRTVLKPMLEAAPLAIKVGETADCFYVLHADRSRLSYTSPINLMTDTELDEIELATEEQQEVLIWSRRLAREASRNSLGGDGPTIAEYAKAEKNLSLTFVGHTVVDRPIL